MKMNKASLILNIVLIIAVLLLYIDRFVNNNNKNTNNPKTKSNNVSSEYPEIVYVNIDTLLSNYDLYNQLMVDIMEKQQNFEKKLNSKILSYQQRSMNLQQQYEKHLITSATYQSKGEKLMMEQQQIAQWKDEKSMELMEDEQNLTKRIYDSILVEINSYNSDSKHKFIINNSFGGALLFGNKTLNITDTIVGLLNSKVDFEVEETEDVIVN